MEKVLRSLIQEKFDLDLRNQIELISLRRDINNSEKQEELIKLLKSSGIKDIAELGSGTNRYAFKLDGYVIKVATDSDGKIDNLKEFKMAPELFPYVTNTYEVSDNGTLLVAEYIESFKTFYHMSQYKDKILDILNKLSDRYLIGDVGLAEKNFGNWGIRIGTDDPVCLDFAYVYEVSSKLFLCPYCNAHPMLEPDSDYNYLMCPNKGCGRVFTFENIREKLGNNIRNQDIGDLEEVGYRLDHSYTLYSLDEQRSSYLKSLNKASKKKDKKEKREPEIIDFSEAFKEENNKMTKLPGIIINKNNLAPVNSNNQTPSNESPTINPPKTVTIPGIIKPKSKDQSPTIDYEKTFDHKDEVTNDDKLAMVINMTPKQDVKEDTTTIVVEPNQINPQFVANKNIYKTVSKISNNIVEYCKNEGLWDDISGYIVDKDYDFVSFYTDIQNAVFRSLTSFLGFTEEKRQLPNGNRRIVFEQPTELNGDVKDTILYLQEYWANDNEVPTDSDRVIQEEWLPVLIERLTTKLPITEVGANIIATTIGVEYCDMDPVDIVDSISDDIDAISVEVTTGGDPRFDMIKLFNGYLFDPGVYIPFFHKWNSSEINKNYENDINGEWSWLKHMVPTYIALVDDPKKYMIINRYNMPSESYRIKVAYLNKVKDKYAIGVYVVGNIITYDENSDAEHDTSQIEMLNSIEDMRKINYIICNNLENTEISYLKYALDDASNQEEDNVDRIEQLLSDAMYAANSIHECECGHVHEVPESRINTNNQLQPNEMEAIIKHLQNNMDVQETPTEGKNTSTSITKNLVTNTPTPIQAPPSLEVPLNAEGITIKDLPQYEEDDVEDFIEDDSEGYDADDLDIETFDIEEDQIIMTTPEKEIEQPKVEVPKEAEPVSTTSTTEEKPKKRMITPIIPDKYKK